MKRHKQPNKALLRTSHKVRRPENADVGPKIMKMILAIIAGLLLAGTCLAQGYGDYELDIGDGYTVVRCNGMDVCIGSADQGLIIYPSKYDNLGPIVQYITTPEYIFTRNYGRKPRNLHKGDTFEDVDPSQEYFFSISKGSGVVQGPFSKNDFSQLPEVANLGQLDWQSPENPDPWGLFRDHPRLLIVFFPILAIRYFWITIPVIVGLVLLITKIRKNLKMKAQQGGPGYPPQGVGSPDP